MSELDRNASAKLRVFLCHSSGDKPVVRRLHDKLSAEGFQPWLDERDLIGGQEWEEEIPAQVRRSHIVVVCLSNEAVTKVGYVQKEIKYALDIADEHPDGTIFVVPLRIEQCEIPRRLKHLHCVNFFQHDGYEQLIRALRSRAQSLKIEVKGSRRDPFVIGVATLAISPGLILECDLTKHYDPENEEFWQFDLRLRDRSGDEEKVPVELHITVGSRVANEFARHGLSRDQFTLLSGQIAKLVQALPAGTTKNRRVEGLMREMMVRG